MNRRNFITLAAGVAGAARMAAPALAQQRNSVRRVGVLFNLSSDDQEGRVRIAAFRSGLKELGWIEGGNIRLHDRWAAGDQGLARTQAAELVAMGCDVILAGSSFALRTIQQETRTIPIVFAQVPDPVGAGFVDSLARPSGNTTGFSSLEFPLAAKWLEVLTQLAPHVRRAAVVYDPSVREAGRYVATIEAAARPIGIQVSSSAVRDVGELALSIESFGREPDGGLIPIPGPKVSVNRDLIISLANRHRLPNVYGYRYFPANGGLASYGIDNVQLYRQAAGYVDRIIRGEKPRDLPVQQPTKFELVINLKSAKTIGLDVPHNLLALADEVIE
jgi:putative ABC transport system substrate-binding protein